MVLSWIMHALDSEVAQSVLWMNIASEVWVELRQRYYQGDLFRICEVQEEIYTLKQGDVSIKSYFTRLKGYGRNWTTIDQFLRASALYNALAPCCLLCRAIEIMTM